MSIKGKIKTIESLSESIKEGRQSINNKRKTKVRNKRILDNYEILLRRELDTSPGQTIVTKSGLFIDYDPDLKKGKTKKYRQELVNPPFSQFYKVPDKEVMKNYLDEDFKVIYENEHVADLVFTKFKIEEKDKGGRFGGGIGKDWDGDVTRIPQSSMIQVTWSGVETEGDFSRQIYNRTGRPGSKESVEGFYKRNVKGDNHGFKIVKYDDWGSHPDWVNRDYYMIVWTMEDILNTIDWSIPESINWGSGKYHCGLYARVSHESHHSGYEIMRGTYSAAAWMKAVSNYGMYRVYRFGYPNYHQFWLRRTQYDGGTPVEYIEYRPISHIKIWNKDDEDDIAYDGRFDELWKPDHKL